ncbi:MAG: Lrp/AsnC family transcriptional regulator, partial [Crenarchaeota archaeon]|nr:Lrp/AsnC family transcriptional regulator [Thermoproteota archaeon]
IVKRYQKLEANGILKIIIQIDPKKLGYNSILDFNIACTLPSNSSGIIESLMKIPDVVSVIKTSGDYDLQITSIVRDVEQMFKLQEEIEKIIGVVKIETGTRKIPTKWPPPQQHISTF